MLTRIISAAVGIVIMAAVLFFHKTFILPVAVSAIIAIMLYELLRAVNMHKCVPVLISALACGISGPLIYEFIGDPVFDETQGIAVPDGRWATVSGCVTLLAVFVVFMTWLKKHKEIRYEQVFFVLAVMLLIPSAMTTMVRLDRETGDVLLLILGLCGAWVADSGAYFTGVFLGRHKLCPEISPKKTVEGLVGGIVTTAVVFAVIGYFSFGRESAGGIEAVADVAIFAVIGMVCAGVGTVGDLSASMVKRQIGIKDYGRIMPGHGGLMDRFDSVLFVLPTFYYLISLYEQFL